MVGRKREEGRGIREMEEAGEENEGRERSGRRIGNNGRKTGGGGSMTRRGGRRIGGGGRRR